MWGIAALISPIENSRQKYMTITTTSAIAMPPNPAVSVPKFQPEKAPEITAATPMPQMPQKPADRFSWRFSK